MTAPVAHFYRGAMSPTALLTQEPQRILLPHFDTLGDIVLFEGFVRALLKRFPQAKTTLLIRRVYADLACLFPDVLEWLVTDVDPHQQSPDKALIEQLIEDMDGASPDLVLVSAHNRTWADDLVAAKAREAMGFAVGSWAPMPSAHRKVFEESGLSADCPYKGLVDVSESAHEVEKHRTFWHALTGESALPEPRLRVGEHQRAAAEKILQFAGLQSKSFCFCAPAGTQKVAIKTWPPERFAQTIVWLDSILGIPSLVAGHRSESIRMEEVARLARAQGANPKIWLGRDGEIPLLAALLESARFYFGNDTGPMHMAAAVGTPVVAVFGGGTWPRFIPRGAESSAIAGKMPCFGCGWDCIFEDAPCMGLVTLDDAKAAIESVCRTPAVPEGKMERVRPASTRLSEETCRYIEKAIEGRRKLKATIARIDADRTARLDLIDELEGRLQQIEADRASRLELIERLNRTLSEVEEDRAARLVLIEKSDAMLKTKQQELEQVLQELRLTQGTLSRLRSSLAVRILNKLRLLPS